MCLLKYINALNSMFESELAKRILVGTIYLSVILLFSMTKHTALFYYIVFVALVLELIYGINKSKSSNKIKYSIVFIFLLYLLSCFIYLINENENIFLIIFFASLVDISAYVTGKIIGGAKLLPKISPNKTISGFLGGILIPTYISIVALYNSLIFPLTWDFFVNFGVWIMISASIFAQIGDLLISYAKRKLQIKDFASWLPGHGGIWDRFDSVLGIILFGIICHILA